VQLLACSSLLPLVPESSTGWRHGEFGLGEDLAPSSEDLAGVNSGHGPNNSPPILC
jgi:hypothetical protein